MAVYYFAGCDVEVPDHICDPCEKQEKGRVDGVAFIANGFEFTNPSNPAEWAAGVANKSIRVIGQVIGSFDGGTEVEGSGYGRQATKLLGFNMTSNFRDPNYKQNAEFYDALKNSSGWRYAWKTETQVHISDNAVSVIPKNPVTEELNSDVVWDVTVKWDQDGLARPYDAPTGIFGNCYNVAP